MPTSARFLAVSAVLTGWALGCAAPALAAPQEPPPPPPPAPVGVLPPLAGIGTAMAQSDSVSSGPLGLPDLSAYGPNLLLGQSAIPTAPGDATQVVIPGFSAFNPDYLLPQNVAPAAPGDGTAAPGIGPDADSTGTGRIAFLRRLHEMYEAGLLKGALLGQQPPEVFDPPASDPPPAG